MVQTVTNFNDEFVSYNRTDTINNRSGQSSCKTNEQKRTFSKTSCIPYHTHMVCTDTYNTTVNCPFSDIQYDVLVLSRYQVPVTGAYTYGAARTGSVTTTKQG